MSALQGKVAVDGARHFLFATPAMLQQLCVAVLHCYVPTSQAGVQGSLPQVAVQ